MTTQTGRLTYEEYINGPEIKARYDIVDGEMIMAPAPTYAHQTASRQLFRILDKFVVERQLGEVYYAPFDVLIRRDALRTRQPDLMFISNDRKAILGDVIEGGPDLVIEITSPSNTRLNLEAKLTDYAQIDVRECWLTSPQAGTVEVLELADGQWQRLSLSGLGDSVRSQVLDGLEVSVSGIFQQ